MATLMETLNKQLETPAAAPAADLTEQAQNVLRAKLGSAAGAGSGPRRSNIAEQAAVQQTQTALDQGQQENKLLAKNIEQGFAQQEQQTEQQFSSLAENLEDMRGAFERESTNILEELGRQNKELDFNRDAAKLEQLGFNLRFQDNKYVTELENQARSLNLNNDLNFKEEMAKTILEDSMELFKGNLNFQKFINMDNRKFAEEMATMDINAAMQLAQAGIAAEKEQALFTGIGGLIQGGLTYGANIADINEKEKAALEKDARSLPTASV